MIPDSRLLLYITRYTILQAGLFAVGPPPWNSPLPAPEAQPSHLYNVRDSFSASTPGCACTHSLTWLITTTSAGAPGHPPLPHPATSHVSKCQYTAQPLQLASQAVLLPLTQLAVSQARSSLPAPQAAWDAGDRCSICCGRPQSASCCAHWCLALWPWIPVRRVPGSCARL